LLVLFVVCLISGTLLIGRSPHLLLGFIVIAGWSQAVLASLTHSTAFLYADDAATFFLVVYAAERTLGSRDKRDRTAALLFLGLLGLSALAVLRSPDLGVGLEQARQVLFPLGLVFAGFVLRDERPWERVLPCVVALTMVAVAWALAEQYLARPLLDAVWYYTVAVGGARNTLRIGLPPSYFADGVGGSTVFRSGGPFMNPPVLGLFLGLGAYAAIRTLREWSRFWTLGAIGLALAFTYARAGILVFVVLTLVYLVWSRVGRWASVITGGSLGAYMAVVFLQQGATANHANGLLSGILIATRTPLGLGFGTSGYQATLEGATKGGAGGESLLGLYVAWLRWPMLILVLWTGVRLWSALRSTPRRSSLPIWLSVAFLLAAASSESTSSIATTPVFWMICGLVIVQSKRGSGVRKVDSVASTAFDAGTKVNAGRA